MQLEHVQEEGTREEHGSVTLLSADGTMLAQSSDFQHNRKYRSRFEMADELIAEVNEKAKKLMPAAAHPTAAPATPAAPAAGAAAA